MDSNIVMTREEIIALSIEARTQEVMNYQINIDNYTLALQKISEMTLSEQQELNEFRNQLSSLLVSEKLEQKKAKLMLSVLQDQSIG